MNSTKGLILVTVIVTAVTTFIREAGKGKVEFRSFLGASFMGIFLTGIGMVNARLARNFCLLIIFGVLLKDGGNIFKFAGQASSQGLSKVPQQSFKPTTLRQAHGG